MNAEERPGKLTRVNLIGWSSENGGSGHVSREREGRVAGFITTYLLPAPLAPEAETRVAAEVTLPIFI